MPSSATVVDLAALNTAFKGTLAANRTVDRILPTLRKLKKHEIRAVLEFVMVAENQFAMQRVVNAIKDKFNIDFTDNEAAADIVATAIIYNSESTEPEPKPTRKITKKKALPSQQSDDEKEEISVERPVKRRKPAYARRTGPTPAELADRKWTSISTTRNKRAPPPTTTTEEFSEGENGGLQYSRSCTGPPSKRLKSALPSKRKKVLLSEATVHDSSDTDTSGVEGGPSGEGSGKSKRKASPSLDDGSEGDDIMEGFLTTKKTSTIVPDSQPPNQSEDSTTDSDSGDSSATDSDSDDEGNGVGEQTQLARKVAAEGEEEAAGEEEVAAEGEEEAAGEEEAVGGTEQVAVEGEEESEEASGVEEEVAGGTEPGVKVVNEGEGEGEEQGDKLVDEGEEEDGSAGNSDTDRGESAISGKKRCGYETRKGTKCKKKVPCSFAKHSQEKDIDL